jgi:hypothetical protein
MDIKNIQSIMTRMVDDNISVDRIDLWPSVRNSLIARNHPLFFQGENMNSQKVNKNRISIKLALSLAVMVLLGLFFITPTGQVLAQNILKFFIRSSENSLPVPTMSAPMVAQPEQPEVNSNQVQPTTIPANNLPFQQTCGNLTTPRCSLAQIQTMVKFQVFELTALPADVHLLGGTGGPEQLILVYAGDGVNGTLQLLQEPATSEVNQQIVVASSAEVEGATVANLPAEYVNGAWFGVETNDGLLGWHQDAGIQTLRWQAGDVRLSLVYIAGKMDKGIVFDKSSLVELAGHVTKAGLTGTNSSVTPDLTLDQLSRKVGFEIVQPGWLPEGYSFQEAAYVPDRKGICLYYSYQDGQDGFPLMAVYEGPLNSAPSAPDLKMIMTYEGKELDTPLDTQSIPVVGAKDDTGQLISNGVDASKLCAYPNYVANLGLVWQSEDHGYAILGLLDQFQGRGFVTRLEMQHIAADLDGKDFPDATTIDPDRLKSVKDATNLAGFAVKSPAWMLQDQYFDHALVRKSSDLTEAYLIYSGGVNGDGRRYGFNIIQTTGNTQTLEETFLAGGYEHVTIHGQPGIYREICWATPTDDKTECYQESTWFYEGIRFDLNAYLPGLLNKAEYLKIADSLQ